MRAPPEPRYFLDLLPQEERSTLAQHFYKAARHGTTPAESLVVEVEQDLEAAAQHDWTAANQPWVGSYREHVITRAQRYERWLTVLGDYPEETREYARYVLWREALPPALRAREKQLRYAEVRAAEQRQEPATEKQLAYLRALGWREGAASKAEASTLISRLKNPPPDH